MTLQQIAKNQSFGGELVRYQHVSVATQCSMTFAVYLPPQLQQGLKLPVLYWLSGLTCTDENFMQKAGAQGMAAELGLVIVAPDTSPRGAAVADDDGYDLGQGAGFYVNATEKPWSANYQMYDYITDELPKLIEAHFPVTDKRSIFGHSMGGHGALTIALKNPHHYVSVSAFSPICNPVACPWGKKALSAYLGENQDNWSEYDASMLMRRAKSFIPALVDQGTEDEFLADQLLPQSLVDAAEQINYPLTMRMQEGYDHSYYFIASFIADHLKFHHQALSRS